MHSKEARDTLTKNCTIDSFHYGSMFATKSDDSAQGMSTMASEGLPKTWQELWPWIVTVVVVAFIDHFLGDVYEWLKEICVKGLS